MPEIRGLQVVVGQLEIHVIEDIEELRAELQVHALMNWNRLDGREIPLLERGAKHGGPPDVAKLSWWRMFEGAGVEPAVRSAYRYGHAVLLARAGIWIASQVWPGAKESRNFRRATLRGRIA